MEKDRAQEGPEGYAGYDRAIMPPLEDTFTFGECPECQGVGRVYHGPIEAICPICEGSGIQEQEPDPELEPDEGRY